MDIRVENVSQVSQPDNTHEVKQTDDTFKFTLASKIENAELSEKLGGMMQAIDEQGKKIAKHMDIRDMRHYRELIRSFINEIVTRSHEFTRENFLDKRGRHRVYGMIRLIDENLDALAEDEIKGLLLDITT